MNAKIVSQIVAGIFAIATTWLTVAYTKQTSVTQEKTENITKLEQRVKALESLPASEDKSPGSPYVHWWSGVTDLPLQQCEELTREVYRLSRTPKTESPVTDESTFAQIGIAEPVTSVIVCARIGEKTNVTVISAGPDQTTTDNRQAVVRDLVRARLYH